MRFSIQILSLCVALTACASAPTVMDRPEASHAGCLVLDDRAWGDPPEDLVPSTPILVEGPDTVELQMQLARTGTLEITGVGDSIRFSPDDIRRRRVLNDPLLVYPELADNFEMSLATWRLTDDQLQIQWIVDYVPVGRRVGVRAELRVHLETRGPLRGWAMRSFHRSPYAVNAAPIIAVVDSVPVAAERIPCPEEFPYESTLLGRRAPAMGWAFRARIQIWKGRAGVLRVGTA